MPAMPQNVVWDSGMRMYVYKGAVEPLVKTNGIHDTNRPTDQDWYHAGVAEWHLCYFQGGSWEVFEWFLSYWPEKKAAYDHNIWQRQGGFSGDIGWGGCGNCIQN